MNRVISIVGFGNIGKLICALLLPNKEHHFTINIVDIDPAIKGAITDFEHGIQLYPNHTITHNSEVLLNNSDFIFHCAGASVPKGKSRLYTCRQSIEITEAIFKNFKANKTPFIIVVANPVDIISTITYKLTGLPHTHIIGTGTFLDSIRMNQIVRKVNPKLSSIDSVLIGEHGATTFLSEQLSSIDGRPFSAFFDASELRHNMDLVKSAAAEIKVTQDATIYGVSYCAIQLFEALLSQKSQNLPVSVLIPKTLQKDLGGADLFLSLYATINNQGALPNASYEPNASEIVSLKACVDLILPLIPEKYL